jgi:hypothetical protein
MNSVLPCRAPVCASDSRYSEELMMRLTGQVAVIKRMQGGKLDDLLRIVRGMEVENGILKKNVNFMADEIRKNTREIVGLRELLLQKPLPSL